MGPGVGSFSSVEGEIPSRSTMNCALAQNLPLLRLLHGKGCFRFGNKGSFSKFPKRNEHKSLLDLPPPASPHPPSGPFLSLRFSLFPLFPLKGHYFIDKHLLSSWQLTWSLMFSWAHPVAMAVETGPTYFSKSLRVLLLTGFSFHPYLESCLNKQTNKPS